MTMPELKPCPKCKSQDLVYLTWWTTMTYAAVSCDECDFEVTATGERTADEEVIKIWNSINDWKEFKIKEYLESCKSFKRTAGSYLSMAVELGHNHTDLYEALQAERDELKLQVFEANKTIHRVSAERDALKEQADALCEALEELLNNSGKLYAENLRQMAIQKSQQAINNYKGLK